MKLIRDNVVKTSCNNEEECGKEMWQEMLVM